MAAWNKDFREFFELLNDLSVEFLIIGGVAYNFYAPPRATKDIDIWVNPESDNCAKLIIAIANFGFPIGDLAVDDISSNPRVMMLGRVPNRIDILTFPDGVVWSQAEPRSVHEQYDGVPVRVLGIDDLVLSKRAAGRPRDLADVAMLEEIRARGGGPGQG